MHCCFNTKNGELATNKNKGDQRRVGQTDYKHATINVELKTSCSCKEQIR